MKPVVTSIICVAARSAGEPGKVTVQLAYEPTDPYAVHLLIHHQNDDEAVEWQIGRALLAEGRDKLSGESAGDAQVWPGVCRWPRRPELLHILLKSPDGRIELDVPYQFVSHFLVDTFIAVPAGRESEHLDVDRFIKLLREWA